MLIDTWFGADDAPILGFLHAPDGGARGGVVICPPLGHEHVLAYRTLRFAAQQLETRGVAALRFDYLGEGDASGETARADAPERWLESIAQAVNYLRESGVERIALLGLTSGALLASEAVARIPGVDALAFWDPTLSGRRFLRRQHSLHELSVGTMPPVPDQVSLLSLALHPDAADWIETRAITASGLAALQTDTLVLGRERDRNNPATERLVSALPARAEYRTVTGQEELLEAPSAIAEMPLATIATLADWLSGRFPATRSATRPVVTRHAEVGRTPDGSAIVEMLHRVGPERLFAIETLVDTAPDDAGVVVLQPGAAEHRIGPGRFQVQLARDLAERGYRAIRFDRRITGDSTPVRVGEPNLIFAEAWVEDAEALVTSLAPQTEIAYVGLCAGGWSWARLAERRPSRLTVLMSPNYYKTEPMEPGEYTRLSRLEYEGTPRLSSVKSRVRALTPSWVWRAAARFQIFHDPGVLLDAASRDESSIVALLMSPDDEENFLHHRGADAVARLRRRGADIRVTGYPFGDHSLFSEQVRAAMRIDVLALIDEALPVRAVARGGRS